MREVIARAIYDVQTERGGNPLPWPDQRPLHLQEADAVIEAIHSNIGWPEIRAYQAELDKGQGIHEDGGGYFARAIGALFGRKSDAVENYQQAAERLLREPQTK